MSYSSVEIRFPIVQMLLWAAFFLFIPYVKLGLSKPISRRPWDWWRFTWWILFQVPQSPNFKVVLTLNITRGGGSASQFYLLDIGGCWKNNGEACDGNLAEDVTRYSEMIINPDTPAWCRPDALHLCPPFHTTVDGRRIRRNDTENFPYSAYHLYCVPHNARYAEAPFSVCDPYSNPQPQELQQLLPHPEWAVHGYPSKRGEGWVGDARTWELNVGALSSRLYFYQVHLFPISIYTICWFSPKMNTAPFPKASLLFRRYSSLWLSSSFSSLLLTASRLLVNSYPPLWQDPGTPSAKRQWPSVDVGTEIYISSESETAQWTVSDFNILIPSNEIVTRIDDDESGSKARVSEDWGSQAQARIWMHIAECTLQHVPVRESKSQRWLERCSLSSKV